MNERLRLFISHLGLSIRKFEATIGVKNGYIRTFGEGSRSEIVETILQEYPQLNRDWLLHGFGEMITYTDSNNINYAMDANEILRKVLEITKESRAGLAKSIGLQPYRLHDIARGKSKEFPYEVADKIALTYPQFNREWMLTGEGEMLNTDIQNSTDCEMKASDRINKIVDHFGDSLTTIASKSRINPQRLYDISSGKTKSFSEEVGKKILSTYPQINPYWIFTGDREILTSTEKPTTPITPSERIDQLLSYTGLNVSEFADEIRARSKQSVHDILNGKTASISRNMKRLITSRYSEISESWLSTGSGEMLTSTEAPTTQTGSETDVEDLILTPANSIRFYPDLPATVSNIEDMPQEAYPQYQLMYIQGYEGCLAIPATGRSMEPTIHAGDRIIHEPYLDRFIQNGEIYVICTTTGQRMIKRLVETSRDEDGIPTFTCHSDNPDKDLYAPFTLKGDEIRALYKVRLIIPLSL